MIEPFLCPRRDELPLSVVHTAPDSDQWRADKTCSWCGSLHPDEFMRRVKKGDELIPTDKDYKAYIGAHQKFYYMHLSKEQMIELVKLTNEKRIKFGYPGYFYRRPYFMVPVDKAGTQVEPGKS